MHIRTIEPEIGVSKLRRSHREGRVRCAEDLKGPHLRDNYCHCTPARSFSPFMIAFIVHMCKYQRFMNRRLTSAQSYPNLETILVVLEEVCELLGRRHPVVVEGAVPRSEVLEGKLVCLRQSTTTDITLKANLYASRVSSSWLTLQGPKSLLKQDMSSANMLSSGRIGH